MSNLATSAANIFRRLITAPDEELGRWQRIARDFITLVRRAWMELAKDRAPQLAAALAYRTIFSLIPMLVLSLSVTAAFYNPEDLEGRFNDVMGFLGLQDIAISEQALEQSGPIDEGEMQEATRTVAEWVTALVERVQEVNFAAIGAVGVLLLIYAAVSLIIEIERAFNKIYSAPRPRGVITRITNYWTVLTAGPLALLAGFWVSDRMSSLFQEGIGATIFGFFGALTTFVISWLILLLAYTTMPNARVHKRAALIGAFIGALLWELGKWGFREYLGFSAGYARFYGSLGLIPIFMLWIYITWLVVLFGLEISYSIQTHRRLETTTRTETGTELLDPLATVTIMRLAGRAFVEGGAATLEDIADRLGVSRDLARKLTHELTARRLLRAVEEDGADAFVPGRPLNDIQLAEIVRAGHDIAVPSAEAEDLVAIQAVREAQVQAVGEKTLIDMLERPSKLEKPE